MTQLFSSSTPSMSPRPARSWELRRSRVSAGYICEEPVPSSSGTWMPRTIDLKGFTEEFYKRLCSAQLGPVLDISSRA